ncbi:kinase-like protein [Tothia fuscella]|uniref:Kinase-like protein n=1 Tax=Tothia fuscella TaxID=1048955 RepID=A0A9P4NR96_9PEZI|nr:kinase-like protein [Tothia fuscella]
MGALSTPTPPGIGRHASVPRPLTRPLPALSQAQDFLSGHLPLRNITIKEDSDVDDNLEQPPQLSALGRSVLGHQGESPEKQMDPRVVRTRWKNTASDTPVNHDSTTPPAPSLYVKRVGLHGAPVRRAKPTPPDEGIRVNTHHDPSPAHNQENLFPSIQRLDTGCHRDPDPSSIIKPERSQRIISPQNHLEHLFPSSTVPRNMPPEQRQAPPPPPRMSILTTATVAAGASTTKSKKKRVQFKVNGKLYSQIGGKAGRGGSSDVYRVMAEDSTIYALKKVKLCGVDENAIMGFKGEINLLNSLKGEERVVRLHDYQIDEEKECLFVVMELGEKDLSHILRLQQDPDQKPKLNIPFTRFYWKEMLLCVKAIHVHDIVHSDLKPANFLLVRGQLKLIDFGIANAIDVENTVNVYRDSHVGTINFMSPESLQDSSTTQQYARVSGSNPQVGLGKLMKLGKPSDVWSLGCILYQMVYGQPPFAHISGIVPRVMAIINPLTNIHFPTTGIGGMKIPLELRKTLKACLNRSPSARPTVQDLLFQNDPWSNSEPSKDLFISQELLGQMTANVVRRLKDEGRPEPTEEEIKGYASGFYSKIRDWTENE